MDVSKRNDALAVNYPGNYINYGGGTAQVAITTHGSDWYWAVTALMMVSTLVFCGLAYTKPRSDRIFHYITALITMVASIAYFSMASNIGWAPIEVEFMRGGKVAGMNREIFYVRYIDWVITTPLLLTDLLLTAGVPWPSIIFAIVIDEIMIVTGLCGALVRSRYKWGYYVFGCVALFYIGWALVVEARKSAKALGSDIYKTFLICGTWTFGLWCLYPIAWGVSEGGNVIPPDSEAVFYGVLDIMAKPVFGALLLWGHRNIKPSRLGLHMHDYNAEPSTIPNGNEKSANGTNNTTVGNGATNNTTIGNSATTAEPQVSV